MPNRIKQDISIGNNLQRLRKAAELTQEAAAAKLQVMGFPVSREMLAQMEQGRYSVRVSILLAMKQIYRVKSFDQFFEGLSIQNLQETDR